MPPKERLNEICKELLKALCGQLPANLCYLPGEILSRFASEGRCTSQEADFIKLFVID
ncbi:MAG: hypothetical protein KGJ13_04500 [Patescibacteria group bacterium]|nr:hypothetical protein [Patescibacteria group bacterium]